MALFNVCMSIFMAAIVASFSAHSVRDLASSLTLEATAFSASWQKHAQKNIGY